MSHGTYKNINNLYKDSFKAIFNLIKDNYPFKNRKDFILFKNNFKKHFLKLNSIKTDEDFYIFAKFFVASLGDTHTKIAGYPWKFYKPDKYRVIIENKKFFLLKANKLIGEIFSVDGKKPAMILKKSIELISGKSKQYLIDQGLPFVLADTMDKPAVVEIVSAKSKKIIILNRQLINNPIKPFTESNFLEKDIFYIKISFWSQSIKDDIEREINKILQNNIKLLIVDVRGNSGGDSRIADLFAGHFFKENALFRYYKVRKNKSNFLLSQKQFFIKALAPYINIPIMILTDRACFSSNELFIAGMKDNKRALIIGEKTAGGTGNPKTFEIVSGKYVLKLAVSSWIVKRLNGKLIEGAGIEPDIAVGLKISDIENNRDVVLERALLEAKKIV